MAAPSLLTDKEERFLQTLVEEGVHFMVVGLAAAALQGAPAVTQDIDLWFADLSDPALRRALAKAGATYIGPTIENPPLIAGGDAGLFDIVVHMHGLGTFAQEIRRAVRVPVGAVEVPVLPLDRVIASKKATGRPKDIAVLPALEDAWRVLQSRKA
ncbi:MAG TPA: hypothetical protein VFO85_01565, partial [Vicinamibacteria bacterium]|nr:hypothetical protein [Vicinamibacteria bacterium]